MLGSVRCVVIGETQYGHYPLTIPYGRLPSERLLVVLKASHKQAKEFRELA